MYTGQAQQEGSPPGANQEAKTKQEEGRESARPSRPAVRNISHPKCHPTHTHTQACLLSGFSPLEVSEPSFFLCSLSVAALTFLSLCPFILQSYKKAIDEVSYTRVPSAFSAILISASELLCFPSGMVKFTVAPGYGRTGVTTLHVCLCTCTWWGVDIRPIRARVCMHLICACQ